MLQTTTDFLETLKKNEWKYKDLLELENGSDHVCCGVNGKMTTVDYHFFFDKDGRSFTMRVSRLFAVPIDKKLAIMEVMNTVNKDYRWAKFFINDECWMNIQADAIVTAENAGAVAMELMVRTTQIIDDTYAKFMHEIWA